MTTVTTGTGARGQARARKPSASRRVLKAWGFMSPAMALLLSMTVVPTLYLVYYAFRHEDLLGPNSHWVGFDNFRRVLTDANIGWDAFTTLQFVVLAVVIEVLLGLGLALMLSRKLAETNLITAMFILPLGVAPVVSALVSACCWTRPMAGSITTCRPGGSSTSRSTGSASRFTPGSR